MERMRSCMHCATTLYLTSTNLFIPDSLTQVSPIGEINLNATFSISLLLLLFLLKTEQRMEGKFN